MAQEHFCSEPPPTCQKGYERSENPSAPAWHLLYNMTILLLLGVLPHVSVHILHTQQHKSVSFAAALWCEHEEILTLRGSFVFVFLTANFVACIRFGFPVSFFPSTGTVVSYKGIMALLWLGACRALYNCGGPAGESAGVWWLLVQLSSGASAPSWIFF